jgi:hypothetical protein
MTRPRRSSPDPDSTNPRLKAALHYASQGLQVFPGRPGLKESHKSARFSNGRPWGKTDDPVEIGRDWMRWPDANVCIACGPESNFFVLEVDTPQGHDVDGFASLKALEDAHEPLPETRQAISPSGSLHYYFRWPIGATIRNSASEIGPGVDIRGEGGMVLAPPSVKPGVGEYKWHNQHHVVDAPSWLLALVVDTSHGAAERTPSGDAQASVGKVAAALEVIPNHIDDWEEWNRVGMAVWVATGGHDLGFEAFDRWCQKYPVKYNKQDTIDKWAAYSTKPITKITAGSIFWWANDFDPEWRGRYEATIKNTPVIKNKPGEYAAATLQSEAALIDLGLEIYQRGGRLVRPVVDEVDAAKKTKTYVARLRQVDFPYMTFLLSHHLHFEKYDGRLRRWVKCHPPEQVATMILGRDGDWNFRKIVGVISTQTMRPDGTLLVEPGYDADTKLLLIAPPTLPDDMPQTPDARRRHEGIGVA